MISPLRPHQNADRGPGDACNSLLDPTVWFHKDIPSHISTVCALGWPYLTNPAPKGSCLSCSNDFWERRLVKDPQPPFQWFMTYAIHSPQLFHYWQMVFLALPSVKENTVFANSSFLTLIQTSLSCQGIAWLLATETCTSYGKIGNKKLEDTGLSHRIQW